MVQMTRKQIIDSRFTIECPTCDYTLYGDEPRYFVKCDKCLEINAYDKKKKMMKKFYQEILKGKSSGK